MHLKCRFRTFAVIILATVIAIAIASSGIVAQTPAPQTQPTPIKEGEVPQREESRADPEAGTFVPPKTPWGDPDITGDYNNSDESGIPFERPDEFAGRALDDIHAGRAREAGRSSGSSRPSSARRR